MAPAYAMPRMLERAGLELQDFDFYEIHEAFASQVLATLKAWEDPAFCKDRLGLDAPLGSDRPQQAQRQRIVARAGSPVRGHRRSHRGDAGPKQLAEKGAGRWPDPRSGAAGGQGVTGDPGALRARPARRIPAPTRPRWPDPSRWPSRERGAAAQGRR
jgi:acetyl-CoA C-acetyltransferase